MKDPTENGYVLLVMLVLLLSVGGGWLSIGALTRYNNALTRTISVHDQQGLIDARQSLLSYAAVYPYLYGPTGAGPAHLPCPDTDGYQQASVEPQSGANQRRDGPNPPCSSLSESEGLLPRHIVLPGQRYLFHAEPKQRYEYRVAGSMVNNPLNRVVNLQHLVSVGQDPVATIRLPPDDIEAIAAQVTITGKALAKATKASVAAWVVRRSMMIRDELCSSPSSDVSDIAHIAKSTVGEACQLPASVKPQCHYDESLALLIDRPVVSGNECLLDNLGANTMEGVPALRHWFVRNQWHRSLKLTYRDACELGNPRALSCVLVYSVESRIASGEEEPFIELFWESPS